MKSRGWISPRAIGLVVWFLFWVQEVPGSIPGSPLFYFLASHHPTSVSTPNKHLPWFLYENALILVKGIIIIWINNSRDLGKDLGSENVQEKEEGPPVLPQSSMKRNSKPNRKCFVLCFESNKIDNNPLTNSSKLYGSTRGNTTTTLKENNSWPNLDYALQDCPSTRSKRSSPPLLTSKELSKSLVMGTCSIGRHWKS